MLLWSSFAGHFIQLSQDRISQSRQTLSTLTQWIALHQIKEPHRVYHYFISDFCIKWETEKTICTTVNASVPVFNCATIAGQNKV